MELKKSCPIKKRRSLRHGKKEIPSEGCAKFNNKIQAFNRSKPLIYAVSTDKIRISLKFGFADDMMIFCKSQRAAERTLESVTKFIEEKLFLQVNKDKTHVSRLGPEVKFLGFGFRQKDGEWIATVHKKSREKFKEKIRTLLDRRCPRGIEATKKLLSSVLRGWYNYYSIAISKTKRNPEDGWIRRRIRQLLLKQWKRHWTQFQNMQKLHDHDENMFESCVCVAFSQQGYWDKARTANSVLTNDVLKAEGWTWIDLFR